MTTITLHTSQFTLAQTCVNNCMQHSLNRSLLVIVTVPFIRWTRGHETGCRVGYLLNNNTRRSCNHRPVTCRFGPMDVIRIGSPLKSDSCEHTDFISGAIDQKGLQQSHAADVSYKEASRLLCAACGLEVKNLQNGLHSRRVFNSYHFLYGDREHFSSGIL